jgi:hypothetical protein
MALALSDDALREVMAAAALVPTERRGLFLQRVAAELAGLVAGPGLAAITIVLAVLSRRRCNGCSHFHRLR